MISPAAIPVCAQAPSLEGPYSRALREHAAVRRTAAASERLLARLRQVLSEDAELGQWPGVAFYVVGSLGRKELSAGSDLDLYSTSTTELPADDPFFPGAIDRLRLHLEGTIAIDPKCLRQYSSQKLARAIGTSQDDAENTFTARMLLLLEGQPLCHPTAYFESVSTIADGYFNPRPHRASAPQAVFLLDDLVRYWKTLCVNYEVSASDGSKPVALKCVALRFSRVLTVFSTLLHLLLPDDFGKAGLMRLAPLTPWQRLALALDQLEPLGGLDSFQTAFDEYQSFLEFKQRPGIVQELESDAALLRFWLERGERFSGYFYELLSGPGLDASARRHLLM